MTKGGYQIIDLQDKNHELDVGMVHEGIYDLIEGTRKAILLSGVTIEGVEYRDTFVEPLIIDSAYVCFFYGDKFTVTIQDNDVVIFKQT